MYGRSLERLRRHVLEVARFRVEVAEAGGLDLPVFVDGYDSHGNPLVTVVAEDLTDDIREMFSRSVPASVLVTTMNHQGSPAVFLQSLDGPPETILPEGRPQWGLGELFPGISPTLTDTRSDPRWLKHIMVMTYQNQWDFPGKGATVIGDDGPSLFPAIPKTGPNRDPRLLMASMMDLTRSGR